MTKLLTIILAVGLFAMVAGCGARSNICLSVPKGEVSLICEAAKELNTSPEEVGKWLKIGNAALIYNDVISAAEVIEFIRGAKATLITYRDAKGGITPQMVFDYLNTGYGLLSPEASIMLEILDPFAGVTFNMDVPDFLTDFDIGMLLAHLNEQEALVLQFMAMGE